MDQAGHFQKVFAFERVRWYEGELSLSTARLNAPEVQAPMAAYLAQWESEMRPGEEYLHLRDLLAKMSYRGTDMRAMMKLTEEAEEAHEIPYPAMRWEWRTIMAFPWKQEAHINELELNAVVATVKHRGRNLAKFHRRWHIRVTQPRKLDIAVGEFMEEAYQEGDPITYSGHLLSALKRFYPQLRYKLPISSQLYKNWTKTYKPKRATPASWPLVEAMVALALAQRQRTMALLLAIGFDCMLRTSEMLALCPQHFSFHQGDRALSIAIPGSKTTAGNPQVLLVTDHQLIELARQALPTKSAQHLWAKPASAFRSYFDDLIIGLGFPSGSYVPYALRRGGATFHWQSTLSLDSTVQRGRWACVKTARLYIDEGTYQLAALSWTTKQSRLVRQWRKRGKSLRLRQKI
eukprot:Skav222287  [mRNA]  locus=scaffold807:294967:296464:- [translate_table: standard]